MKNFLFILGLLFLMNGVSIAQDDYSGDYNYSDWESSPDWDNSYEGDDLFDLDSLFDGESVSEGDTSSNEDDTLDLDSFLNWDRSSDWVSTLNWNIDSVFDEPFIAPSPSGSTGKSSASSGQSITGLVRRRGLILDAKYEFIAGIAPGWTEPPWFKDDDTEFSWGQNAKMRSDIGLTAQISEVFRVRTVVYFTIPKFKFTLGDFFFDYNILDTVFIKAGKYKQSWGLSSNFEFTNLLTRAPSRKVLRFYEPFIFKVDVPIGIGGIQALAQTRVDLMGDAKPPGWKHIGYGVKYNLALRWADFDLGVYYFDEMPFRGFFSIKTTIGETELYNEWLGTNIDKPKEFSGAFNIGFYRDFFGGDLSLNGELFYNAEGDALFYQSETMIKDASITPFIEGLNFALNVIYKFGGKINPRFYIQTLYAPQEDSARLVPGFRVNPLPNLEVYLAVPMALGSKEGYYYKRPLATLDPLKKPFSVVMLFTLKGSVRAGYYY